MQYYIKAGDKMLNLSNLFLLILFSLILTNGCSEDSPSEPEETNIQVLTSKSIGIEGGELKTETVEISIPPGALSVSTDLSIYNSTEENLFSQKEVSEFFVIDGLPSTINKPIKLKIKYDGVLSDSSYIAIGENNFTCSSNNLLTSFRLLSASDSAGYLIATLIPLNETNDENIILSKTNEDAISLNIGAISGYASYISSQGHFKINFPAWVLNEVYDLGDYLEYAYNSFQNIGFSYSRRTKWPVEVTVKKLDAAVFGYSYNSVWGDNYGYMEFNVDKMFNKEDLKVTAGHEFFHLVQSLYDPRNRFSKAKFQSEHLWLDEAAAVWSEYLFSNSGIEYTSPIFANNAYEILKGIAISTGDNAQSYGYAMASLIKYITSKYGNNSLVTIYENVYNGQSVTRAVSSVLPVGLSYTWKSYLKSLFSFEIYKSDLFRTSTLLSTAKIKSQNFLIDSADDTLKVFESSLQDLSATIFSVNNLFDNLQDNAKLEFVCEGWELQVYKVNGSTSSLLASGTDTIIVDKFKDLSDDGYQIVAVLINDELNLPYDSKKDYNMQIRVKAPKTIKWIYFAVSYTGTFDYTTSQGTETRVSESGMDFTIWNKGGEFSGNTVQLTQDSTDSYNQTNSTIELTFDDIDNPSTITNFTFLQTENSVKYDVTTNNAASGSGVPFTKDKYGSTGLKWRFEGNISQYLTHLTYKMTQKIYDGSYNTDQLVSYESEGIISIIIDYK